MKQLLLQLKRSLSARLLAVFAVTSILLSALLFIAIAHAFTSNWRANVRPHLEQILDFISEEIGDPPNTKSADDLAERLPVNIYIVGPDGTYSTNGQDLNIDDESFTKRTHGAYKRRVPENSSYAFSGDENRTLLRSDVGEYQVFYELAHLNDAKQRRGFITPALLIALCMLMLCFLVIKRMLRPVRDIRDGVKLMGEGDLSHRVPIRHDNDLGQLAGSINTMASDIEQMLDAKRQLLLGASHELRTPLTRAKVAVQLLDESKQRQLLEEDLLEMEQLIADILESERMKSGHAALHQTPVDLIKLAQSVVNEMHSDNIIVQSPSSISLIQGDETRLRILIRNLLSNAIKHNDNDRAKVSINIEQIHEQIQLSVSDSGPGIAEEHINTVTEPFFRIDQSRTRATGGFGLGLHLAKLIAEAHNGSLHIKSSTAGNGTSGTNIVITLPLSLTKKT